MTSIDLATITLAGTAVVLAPIPAAVVRDLNDAHDTPEPAPAPEPVFDDTLVRRVRTALGMPYWTPRPWLGETETRTILWSQLELNGVYERVGGTVTTRTVQRTTHGGESTWQATEITVTVDLPGIGAVEAVTDWDEDTGGRDLPLMQAIAPAPHILETVPANGRLQGYDRFAIAPGAPLPDGRTIVTVEDPQGLAWHVTDDHGGVHWLHKYGQLIRYTSGGVSFIETEWAGWSSD